LSNWRRVTDWAKHKPFTLKLADRLGRSRGRLRVLDGLSTPPPAPFKPDLSDWESHDLAAVWLGHATILLRIGGPGGMTIITDPVLSNRVGVGLGLFTGGPRRLVAPALSVAELPRIDLILISHAHFDHLDRPTLARLAKRAPVVTAHHTADLIRDLGFRRVRELRWGERVHVGGAGPAGVDITAEEVRHWGARTFYDSHRGFNAYLIESPAAGTADGEAAPPRTRVLYGGDTAYQEHFKRIGKVDLAIVGIGAYDPYIAAHATPEQAMAMADHVQASYVLPMHHSTFRLSHEPVAEPMQRMVAAAGVNADRVVIREVGRMWVKPPGPRE
jgi:L-ascorbate metabolism protein UlaG (beta-lactamase superfamily)